MAENDDRPTNPDPQDHRVKAIRNWLSDYGSVPPKSVSLAQLRYWMVEARDVLGPDHPVTLALADHLARNLRAIFGSNHPFSLEIRVNPDPASDGTHQVRHIPAQRGSGI
jgi:hypothetical protein